MIEVRRDLELPSVRDGDQQAVPKLAEFLLEVVDETIPAVGIDHTIDQAMGHHQVHRYHQSLILQAAALVSPEVNIGDSFYRVGDLQKDPKQPFHYDSPRRTLNDGVAVQKNGLPLYLRLHTADPNNGAHIVAANSRPGIDPASVNDRAVVELRGAWRQKALDGLDYDPRLHQSGRISREAVIGVYEGANGIDTTRSSRDVYEYTQQPLSSFFFRSRAALGSVTLHGFLSIDSRQPRNFYISNIIAFAQPIQST